MLEYGYTLVIDSVEGGNAYRFYFPDLQGVGGTGPSINACLVLARVAVEAHLGLLEDEGLPRPDPSPDPQIVIDGNVGYGLA